MVGNYKTGCVLKLNYKAPFFKLKLSSNSLNILSET